MSIFYLAYSKLVLFGKSDIVIQSLRLLSSFIPQPDFLKNNCAYNMRLS